MSLLRAAPRALGLALHVSWGLLLTLLLGLRGRRPGAERIRAWHRQLLLILDVRVRIHGAPAPLPHLLVANHVSWLDIPLLGSCQAGRFVAKADIAAWPLVRRLADATRTFYLARGRGATAALREALSAHLSAGGCVVLFPEGTTSTGQGLLPFHPRLFAAALAAGCAVQPVALRYRSTQGTCVAPFVGDDALHSHLLRLLRAPSVEAELWFCPPIPSAGRSRDELAAAAQAAIAAALALPPCSAAGLVPDASGLPALESGVEGVAIR